MVQKQETLRGLPEWAVRTYLEQIGAYPIEDVPKTTKMQTSDWSASWSTRTVHVPGWPLPISEITIVFNGEDNAVEDAFRMFMKKAQRAGG